MTTSASHLVVWILAALSRRQVEGGHLGGWIRGSRRLGREGADGQPSMVWGARMGGRGRRLAIDCVGWEEGTDGAVDGGGGPIKICVGMRENREGIGGLNRFIRLGRVHRPHTDTAMGDVTICSHHSLFSLTCADLEVSFGWWRYDHPG